MHAALADKPELLPDRVHPNTAGAGEMAKAALTALTGKPAPTAK
jgi:lysophospholipase L1-like esterase